MHLFNAMPFHVALCLQMNQFSANEKKCCCAKLDELVADFERADACGQLFRLSPLRLHPLMFVRQRIPVSEYNPFAAPDSFGHATENFQGRTYGGIRRLPYFVYSLLINIVSTALQFAMAAGDISGLVLVVSLAGAVFGIWIAVQRLINVGLSGWWVLGLIVPILNIWVAVQCIAAPEGYAQHKKLDTAGKVIIGLFLGAIFLVIAMLVLAGSR